MDLALQERMDRRAQRERAGKDRRNGYYERDLLTT